VNVRRARGPHNRSILSHNRAVCPVAVLLAICCCLPIFSGQRLEAAIQPPSLSRPGFDPGDVVQQVRSNRPGPSAAVCEPIAFDNGEFLIDTSVTPVNSPNDQLMPAVAFDGTNFLVVWGDFRSTSIYPDIYGARVTPQGTVLDLAGFVISQAANYQGKPALAYDGANFLVVWDDKRNGSVDVYGSRVTPEGVVLDPAGIGISTAAENQGTPTIAFDGTNFLVTWQDYRSGPHIYGARITPAGGVLDPAGFVISHGTGTEGLPALAFDGANYLVVWQDSRNATFDVYGSRVTPGGVVLDSVDTAISTAGGAQGDPAIGFDGEDFLVVWEDVRNSSCDIYGSRVTPEGEVLDMAGVAISTASGRQWCPALDFDSENFLVTWEDERNGPFDVYGARVTRQGSVLDPSGLVISQAVDNQTFPALGFDGANFLVVWADERGGRDLDIYGTRVTPQWSVIDSTGIAISTTTGFQESPATAFDGVNFLVVWRDERTDGTYDICGARVTLAGGVPDPAGIAISTAARNQGSPALALGSENSLVVWEDNRSGSYDIYGARVTPQGVVLDSAGFVISQAANDQRVPALGFDGANFLVAWQDYRGGSYCDIYGARVTPEGRVLDSASLVISQAANNQSSPALAFDGANYLVAWQDYRGGSYCDIYGARVTPEGTVLDSASLVISQAANNQFSPALACDGSNLLVVWNDNRSDLLGDIYGARVTPGGVVLDSTGLVISQAAYNQYSPALAFDGSSFLVVWQDYRGSDLDIYGARVTPGGTVFESGVVVRQEGPQSCPRLCRANDGRMLIAYQGWAGTVDDKIYNTDRIWGKIDPNPAIAEIAKPELRMTNGGASIIYGVLCLPEATSHKPQAASLMDISGRKVLDLKPGANDVRALAPGVYFVRETQAQAQAQAVRKVILTR
jgi:phosphoribosylformylglycinamidine (FGAM) synthase PurS component